MRLDPADACRRCLSKAVPAARDGVALDDGREAGIAAIQSVIVYPVALLLIATMVQGVLYFHAQNVAHNVANGAVQAARIDGGTREAGYAEAESRLARSHNAIGSVKVKITKNAAMARATVSGEIPSLVPGLKLEVQRTAVGPVERFTSRSQP